MGSTLDCKYGISYRELQEILAEQGVNVDHYTIYRWVQRYAPEMENVCAGTGETLPGSAPGISMKLISEFMADGLTCTALLTVKVTLSIFIYPRAVTARRPHMVRRWRY